MYSAGDYGTRRYSKKGAGAGGGEAETEADPPSAVSRSFTGCRITAEPTDPRINVWSLDYRADLTLLSIIHEFWLDSLDYALSLLMQHRLQTTCLSATSIFLQLYLKSVFLSPDLFSRYLLVAVLAVSSAVLLCQCRHHSLFYCCHYWLFYWKKIEIIIGLVEPTCV